ncbi:HAD hydrolase-like protein [Priestia megaterium]|uniref:HAD hydrolase-like protein n=1 Tax=Priestia megaterium TaxID=1404 RepID=UPI00286D5986|nr:HAD hydrolase-like protein [Priestia megaterium]
MCYFHFKRFKLLDVFYCPHGKHEGCTCIKPEIGMIMKATYKYPEIKLGECFMVGDSTVDVELAINLGIKGFGIGVGSNYKQENIHELNTIKDLPSYI